MSKLEKALGKAAKTGPRYVPDHDRIVRGIPFEGPAEEPCPAPVPCREWTPEQHEIYPSGPWERVSYMTGDQDIHGGAFVCWVHEVYSRRCKLRKYKRDTAAKQAAQQFSDPSGRYEQGYGRDEA